MMFGCKEVGYLASGRPVHRILVCVRVGYFVEFGVAEGVGDRLFALLGDFLSYIMTSMSNDDDMYECGRQKLES